MLPLTDLLLNSSVLPAYAVDPGFWLSVAALGLRVHIVRTDNTPASILKINGEPQQAILARLNATKDQPRGKKLRHPPKALGKKGELRQESDRADVKAVLRQHAQEDSHVQRHYECEFKRQKRWSWNRVVKEARKQGLKLSAAGL